MMVILRGASFFVAAGKKLLSQHRGDLCLNLQIIQICHEIAAFDGTKGRSEIGGSLTERLLGIFLLLSVNIKWLFFKYIICKLSLFKAISLIMIKINIVV